MKKIVILGAGISGLSAAWYLQKRFQGKVSITIVEKSDRIGGWIHTTEKDGFLFERGPRAIRLAGKGKETFALAQDLGLEMVPTSPEANKRYLLSNGKLEAFSPAFLLKKGLLFALAKDLFASPCKELDETIESFFRRRLGPKLTDMVIDPLVKGIYGGEIASLSMHSCFPLFHEWEKRFGGLCKGILRKEKSESQKGLISFKGGMSRLPEALAERINAEICLSTEVLSIKEGVITTTKGLLKADHILSALPAHALYSLLEPKIEALNIPFLSLTTVNLGFRSDVLKKKGFGYLVPSKEKESILGVTFDSSIFPSRESQTRLCVMMRPQDHPKEVALSALSRHLSIHERPDVIDIHTAHLAVPQYLPFHAERIASLNLPYLTLLGNSYEGVGVNDCIHMAKKVIEERVAPRFSNE